LLGLPALFGWMGRRRAENEDMTNDRGRGGDVRWLDERALHAAVVAGDAEAFAELMRRYESVVRSKLGRVLADGRASATERADERVAEFWCGLVREDQRALREWDADRCGLLAPWLGLLAARAAAEELRRRAPARGRQPERDRGPRSLAQ
jgi:hypothetical protein